MKSSQFVAIVIFIGLVIAMVWGVYAVGNALVKWGDLERGTVISAGGVAALIFLCTCIVASSQVRASRHVRSQVNLAQLYLEVLEHFQLVQPNPSGNEARTRLERRLALEASNQVLRQYIHCRQAWKAKEGFEQAYQELVEAMRRDVRDETGALAKPLIAQLLTPSGQGDHSRNQTDSDATSGVA